MEDGCFTILCPCLLHSKMHQPYLYTHPLPFALPSHSGHHRALSGVPVLYGMFSWVICFIHSINSVHISLPISQFTLASPPWYWFNAFVLYISVPVSAFQRWSLFLAAWYEKLTHWKRPWYWGRLNAGEVGGMVGWHHWLSGHELEQAPGDGEGQGSLECCSPWGHKE